MKILLCCEVVSVWADFDGTTLSHATHCSCHAKILYNSHHLTFFVVVVVVVVVVFTQVVECIAESLTILETPLLVKVR